MGALNRGALTFCKGGGKVNFGNLIFSSLKQKPRIVKIPNEILNEGNIVNNVEQSYSECSMFLAHDRELNRHPPLINTCFKTGFVFFFNLSNLP